MAGYVVRAVAASGLPGPWLMAYVPEANDGMGAAVWTAVIEDALRFESFVAAMECWRQVPANRLVRDDGQPNRPLTAFTVEIGRV